MLVLKMEFIHKVDHQVLSQGEHGIVVYHFPGIAVRPGQRQFSQAGKMEGVDQLSRQMRVESKIDTSKVFGVMCLYKIWTVYIVVIEQVQLFESGEVQ